MPPGSAFSGDRGLLPFVDGEPELAGHGGDLLPPALAGPDEERKNEVVGRKSGLANETAPAGRGPQAARSVSEFHW